MKTTLRAIAVVGITSAALLQPIDAFAGELQVVDNTNNGHGIFGEITTENRPGVEKPGTEIGDGSSDDNYLGGPIGPGMGDGTDSDDMQVTPGDLAPEGEENEGRPETGPVGPGMGDGTDSDDMQVTPGDLAPEGEENEGRPETGPVGPGMGDGTDSDDMQVTPGDLAPEGEENEGRPETGPVGPGMGDGTDSDDMQVTPGDLAPEGEENEGRPETGPVGPGMGDGTDSDDMQVTPGDLAPEGEENEGRPETGPVGPGMGDGTDSDDMGIIPGTPDVEIDPEFTHPGEGIPEIPGTERPEVDRPTAGDIEDEFNQPGEGILGEGDTNDGSDEDNFLVEAPVFEDVLDGSGDYSFGVGTPNIENPVLDGSEDDMFTNPSDNKDNTPVLDGSEDDKFTEPQLPAVGDGTEEDDMAIMPNEDVVIPTEETYNSSINPKTGDGGIFAAALAGISSLCGLVLNRKKN